MPKVYKDCVRNNINKGLKKKDAQRKCAIWYYKKFGKTPSHSESEEISSEEREFFAVLELLYETIAKK